MGGLYGGSGGSSLYGSGGSTSTAQAAHHSILGNLLHDIEDTAKGTPSGIIKAVEHPIAAGKAMGKATWADWSPLIEGHPQKWWIQFHAHPLAPLLDLSAFFTGGAGAAARGARLLADAGKAGDEASAISRLAAFSRPDTAKLLKYDEKGRATTAPAMEKRLSTNPLTKYRQQKMSKLADNLSQYLPAVSPNARYARAEARTIQGRSAALSGWMGMVVAAGKKLSTDHPDRLMYEQASLDNTVKQLADFAFHHDPAKAVPEGYDVLLHGHHYRVPYKVTRNPQARSFEDELRSIGSRTTFSPKGKKLKPEEVAQALRTADGKVLIVPRHTASRLGYEGANASKTMKALYQRPTTVWRMMQLGYRPAYFVNNFVGNYFMYAMAHDVAHGFRGYTEALRQAYGKREYRVADTLDKALKKQKGDFQDVHFRDQLGNTMSDSVMQELGQFSKAQRRFSKWSMFPVTHALADRFLRRASINAHLLEEPAVKQAMKSGMSFKDAASSVLDAERSAGKSDIRNRVAQRTMDTMGDYHTLSKGEQTMRKFVPFYSWDRHIARHIAQTFGERPARMAAIAKLGQQGTEANEKVLGDIPAFLKGAIPLSILGLHIDHPSRVAALSTQGLNPYSTIPDLANTAARLVSRHGGSAGETVGSQLNPFLEAAAGAVTGTNPLSGKPNHPGKYGVVGDVAAAPFAGLQITQLLKVLGGGTPKAKDPNHPFLYEKDAMQYLSSILGIPIKQINKARAAELAKAERRRH